VYATHTHGVYLTGRDGWREGGVSRQTLDQAHAPHHNPRQCLCTHRYGTHDTLLAVRHAIRTPCVSDKEVCALLQYHIVVPYSSTHIYYLALLVVYMSVCTQRLSYRQAPPVCTHGSSQLYSSPTLTGISPSSVSVSSSPEISRKPWAAPTGRRPL
jgi:hypothetical protein